jgi:hypothetical protein
MGEESREDHRLDPVFFVEFLRLVDVVLLEDLGVRLDVALQVCI